MDKVAELMETSSHLLSHGQRSRKSVRFARFRLEILVPCVPENYRADLYYSQLELHLAQQEEAAAMFVELSKLGYYDAAENNDGIPVNDVIRTFGFGEGGTSNLTWRGLEDCHLNHSRSGLPSSNKSKTENPTNKSDKIAAYVHAVLNKSRRRQPLNEEALRRFSKSLTKQDRVMAFKMGTSDAKMALGGTMHGSFPLAWLLSGFRRPKAMIAVRRPSFHH